MTVKGRPVPQGDLTAFALTRADGSPVRGKGGRQIVNQTHSNAKSLKPWRNEIAGMAIDAGWPALGLGALDEALIVRLTFVFHRPNDHYGTGRNAGVLKDGAPLYPEKTGGDLDKLTRGVLDALTGIVWKDDKRIVTLAPARRFGPVEQVEIAVRRPRVRTVGELRQLRDMNPLLADALADELQLDLFASVARAAVQEPDQESGERDRDEAESRSPELDPVP